MGGFFLGFATLVLGQSYVVPRGGEYSIAGSLPGDQVSPSIALNSSSAVIAWEDNVVDHNSLGIGSLFLNGNSFVSTGKVFCVNRVATSDQVKPQVALLQGGETFYTWQSKAAGTPDIYARISKNGQFLTSDIRLNTYIKDEQVAPAVAALTDGSAVVAWSSYGQDGNMWGVYARKVLAKGTSPKREFLVNQSTLGNQRDAAVASLASGNFVVAWVSEEGIYDINNIQNVSANVYTRIFSAAGDPITGEIRVNSGTNLCSYPAVAGLADGGFTVVWTEKDAVVRSNSLDIVGRPFSGSGSATGTDFKINGFLYGDQYCPKIASCPIGCLVVWTSLGQDGSWEGVYGRFLLGGNQVAGDEFRVNTTTISQQKYPAVAWSGSQFLVVWSSFVGQTGFDLFGQAYSLNPTP